MKLERHAAIIELIQNYQIETQEELAAKLDEAGYSVTQATVSRDIRELKLIKVSGPAGKSIYALQQGAGRDLNEKYVRVLKDALVSMDTAQNLLVVKTVPGMAMGAAAALDGMRWKEVVGCIAGDDTVMCAIKSADQALLVMERLRKMLSIGLRT